MPSTSKKQHNFMAAVAKNPAFAKKVGVPQTVGEDFLTADKGKKFRQGGTMKKSFKEMEKKEVEFMKKKGAPSSMIKHEKAEMAEEKGEPMKKGGKIKKMAIGGVPTRPTPLPTPAARTMPAPASPTVGKPYGKKPVATTSVSPTLPPAAYMKKGGKVKKMAIGGMPVPSKGVNYVSPNTALGRARAVPPAGFQKPMPASAPGEPPLSRFMKKGGKVTKKAEGGRIASKGEHSVQTKSKRGAEMIKMAKGGLTAGHKSADGCAVRGKTRGTEVKMCGGGYMKKGK